MGVVDKKLDSVAFVRYYLKVFVLLCNLNLRIRLESLFSLVFVRKDGPIREAVFYLDIKTAESRVTIM